MIIYRSQLLAGYDFLNTIHMFRIVFLCCLIIALYACQHKAYTVHTDHSLSICDTYRAISYRYDIQPVFVSNCYACHSAAQASTGALDLETFSSLKAYLNNGFRGDSIYGSKLFHCMLHANLALPMPPTYKLDTCSLNMVYKWLANGALQN